MRSRTTLVALVLVLAFASVAGAEEGPVTLPDLQPASVEAAPDCDAASSAPAAELTLADLNDPIAASTCNVINHWQPESCTCSGGYVRERLYQQVCCPWGCSGLLSTSSTRCSNKPCV